MNKKYTQEDKEQALIRYKSGESIKSISEGMNISRSTLYDWLKKYEQENSDPQPVKISDYNAILRENKRLKEMIEILKSVNCTVRSPLQDKLEELEKLHGKYNVHILCDALEVPRGTFYNHILRNKRDNTYYSKRREDLQAIIQEIYDDSRQIFGAEKITAVMKDRGIRVSERMIRELMNDLGIASIRRSAKKMYDTDVREHRNYVNQNFHTDKPDQVWVSDVTYFKFGDKFLYICAIIDLFSRMVISYKIGNKNSTQLVRSTFKQAYDTRKPTNLIFRSDRGSNYRSKAMCDFLRSLNVTQSFSKPHNPYDNSVMESFFASLKREELYRKKYRSEQELRNAIDEYMIFYNTKRPHAALQYRTPEQTEAGYYDKQAVSKT